MLAYVLNKHGKPLMPCNSRKARLLLKTGNAKVVRIKPFTIRMVHGSSGYTQTVNLGVDAGSKVVGISATTDKKELYSSECKLRTDVTDNLSTRRAFRRARRNRNTRYRPPRFLNRIKSKKKGWLAPTITQKINTHEQLIKQVHNILPARPAGGPISKIIVEVASFDIQKIKNPEISGTEYQQGEQLDFWNVREYVLFRDNHSCQYCKGKSKDKILNVHHIESRKTGGNAPNNLITLCETCHNKHHAKQIKLKVKRGASFRDAAFMTIMRWAFYDRLKEKYSNVSMTYGYLTKNTRISNKLEKSHAIDARCISGNPTAKPSKNAYTQKAIRTKIGNCTRQQSTRAVQENQTRQPSMFLATSFLIMCDTKSRNVLFSAEEQADILI
ncbi:MAG: RNA-guided endonuclease IscB [Defluviitaleaceae bacterium]|nr:RNA-guided endonuclease IscB [Defluviitaleaceae bacterium]